MIGQELINLIQKHTAEKLEIIVTGLYGSSADDIEFCIVEKSQDVSNYLGLGIQGEKAIVLSTSLCTG